MSAFEHFSIIDTETGDTVLDTAWPEIKVKSLDEAMLIGQDQHAYDQGEISPDTFKDRWGIHPDSDYLVAYHFDTETDG